MVNGLIGELIDELRERTLTVQGEMYTDTSLWLGRLEPGMFRTTHDRRRRSNQLSYEFTQ